MVRREICRSPSASSLENFRGRAEKMVPKFENKLLKGIDKHHRESKTVRVIKRGRRNGTRPTAGVVRRATITFHDHEGLLLRIAVDLIFSEILQKPQIIQFETRKSKTARFYLPVGIGDAEVKRVVLDWFKQLSIHDVAKPHVLEILES